ncbi:MAG: hypothetical protein PHH00_03500 [Candidatus Nanoarchaeia archaeon]|nr:hypothetical protein [Candidatus Nanoarchaeia archaeon]
MIKLNSLGFIVYLIVGLYFVNSFFGIITLPLLPGFDYDKWVKLIGGALIIFAGIKLLMQKRTPLIR